MSILASRHSDKEVRSRTSGFQSETSDHEDKAIHPRRTGDWRIPSPYEASTRMFHHVRPCARVACACVYVCSWHCLNLEAWRSRLCFGVKRPRSKRKKDWPPGCSRVLLCELDANLSNGRRSPRSRNRFNDRPWTSHPGRQGDILWWCRCWVSVNQTLQRVQQGRINGTSDYRNRTNQPIVYPDESIRFFVGLKPSLMESKLLFRSKIRTYLRSFSSTNIACNAPCEPDRSLFKVCNSSHRGRH